MTLGQSIGLGMALVGIVVELHEPGWGVLMVICGSAGLILWSEL